MNLEAKGINGQVSIESNALKIKRKGAMGFLTQGIKGDKTIPVKNITSIQFKRPSMLTNGYIQFSILGGREAKGGILQATKEENTIMFKQKQLEAFEAIKDFVERYEESSSHKSSDLDELEKLASLKEKGIITEDEFNKKKKKILDL